MGYVSSGQPQQCIFCHLPQGEDKESMILHRGEFTFIMMNAFPYNTGHLLIAPYRHLADPIEMDPQESSDLLYSIRIAIKILRLAFHAEGFNIGMNVGHMAGAGIADHIHTHVVPRWEGDTNFMAVTASTRVVPEALAETYRKLKMALREEGNKSRSGRRV
jgi:ATP adenylyltransferase